MDPREGVKLVQEISTGAISSRKAHTTPPALCEFGLQSITEVLRYRAETQPEAIAFIHLLDGESDVAEVTYRSLYLDALMIARLLAEVEAGGQRVLLLFDPGFPYISALFGVFLSGAVAVPSFPPVGSRALERLAKIIADAEPHLILTNSRFSKMRDRVLRHLPGFTESQWIDINVQIPSIRARYVCEADAWSQLSAQFASIDSSAVTLLQYTSGSTSDPKGVMLTQANLLSNSEALSSWMGGWRPRTGCTWLPPYHDMGLMGGILLPIYEGFTTVIFSPGHFVQRPYRWLAALSRYRVTTTVAPNFALDLCVDGVSGEDLGGLDLSSISELYCGAEPIRQKTFERFARHFAAAGFKANRLSPCYGMAESTLIVSGKLAGTAPSFLRADPERLARGEFSPVYSENLESIALASSGVLVPHHTVRIVDPQDHVVLKNGCIGEIWVSGGNVARGYWRKPEQSRHTFEAELAGYPQRFMRTGDLGFMFDDELYVTGRLKDLIIVAGRNLYPQDIELAVQEADQRIRANGVVAFSVDNGTTEEVTLVVEIRRGENLAAADLEQMEIAIIERVTAVSGVSPRHIHFAPPSSIPVTTSGKVQRQATKRAFLDNALPRYHHKSLNVGAEHARERTNHFG